MDSLMPRIEPMLVSTGPVPTGEVAYAVKNDGWRSQLQIDGRSGEIRLVTRSGRSVERAVPELAAVATALDGHRAVLDGELIAGDGSPPSFYRLGSRMNATGALAIERGRRSTPVTFVAFDLLWLDGRLLLDKSYRQRRAALEALGFDGPHWVTTTEFADGEALFAACDAIGAEGVIARRLDNSPYLPGRRSRAVVKRKCPGWIRDHAALRRLPAQRMIPPGPEGRR
jgi:bifunctional non-homologous end joining protein LigD